MVYNDDTMWRPTKHLDTLQQMAVGVMTVMMIVTFVAANAHAVLWQSSEWLVSTVLPAVVVDLTNNERADNAAAPLRRNATLDAAAKLKAEHMAKNEYFAHYSPAGVSPWHWFDRAGYVYAHAGENLAIHFTDSTEVVEAWMDSPTHRKNIVDQKFTEIGVGTAKGEFEGYDTVYVVQLFGTPGKTAAPAAEPVSPPVTTESALEEDIALPAADTVSIAQSATTATTSVAVSELAGAASSSLSAEAVEPVVVSPALSKASEEASPDNDVVTNQLVVTESDVASSAADRTSVTVTTTTPTSTAVAAAPVQLRADTVVVQSPLISTSSGLAIAQIETTIPHAGFTFASIATKPNVLLEIMYVSLGVVALMLIVTSMYLEARRLRYRQVAYGVVLLCAMSGLWLFHSWLTSGAVIV